MSKPTNTIRTIETWWKIVLEIGNRRSQTALDLKLKIKESSEKLEDRL